METASGQPLVILNPASNRGNMDRFRAVVRPRAEQEQAEYVETRRQGEAKELAMQAALQNRAVIVVGGDGSVHEVVNGILASGRRVPLGIIAAGSGNDFAFNTLKLPRNLLEAVERAFHGTPIDVDAGKVNTRYFANSFSVGLDADIAVAAESIKKIPFMTGMRLYYTSTLKQLFFGYHRCPYLTFRLEETPEPLQEPAGERRYVLMAVTIGPTYGAGFRINPKADYRDGYFDICTITYAPLPRALKLLPVVKKGEHEGLPEVTFYRAKSVLISSRKTVNMQVDGETTSATTYEAEILPGALLVRV